MNEQIKELIEQAGFEEKDGHISIQGVYMFNTHRMEKFAQLIVRECADVAKETRWAVPPSQEQIARGIQQHFGVEE